jgi:Fe-S-cluster containining protein
MKKAEETNKGPDSHSHILTSLYTAYDSWVGQYSFACHKGCASCCTQFVTITTLEGERIIAFLRKHQLIEKFSQFLKGRSTSMRPLQTTNQFAAQCLAEKESSEDNMPDWDFTPCIFLENNECLIYQVRPFSCRSFSSFQSCSTTGSAEVDPILITMNTVVQQIIEHNSSEAGWWGNMIDILRLLIVTEEEGESKKHVLPAQPNPGFLIHPDEVRSVEAFFARLKLAQACGPDL